MSQSHLTENKTLYMKQKSEETLQECFKRCTKGGTDYKSVSNRQQTCVEYCSVKFNNAFSYAFDLINNGGIHRAPEADLKFRSLLKA